jgi:hypothetical protein
MTSRAPTMGRVSGRLRLAVAGAAVVTVLTAATAAAVAPTPMGVSAPMGVQAPAMTRLGASPSQYPRASSPPPGFLLERGRFKPVAIPRRLEDLAPQGIGPFGINDRGQIVGEYVDAGNVPHGFLLDKAGRFTPIDVPGAKATNAAKINNRGQIVGAYSNDTTDLDANGVPRRGFVLDRGRYIRLDFPGARSSQALDINDRGQVSGDYQDADGVFHGYVWERGRFRTVDGPRAGGTAVAGINNRGQLTGTTGPVQIADAFVLDRGQVRHLQGARRPAHRPLWHQRPGPGRGRRRDCHDGFRVPARPKGPAHRDQPARRQRHRRY